MNKTFALLAALALAVPAAAPTPAQAQERALSDRVVGHPVPVSLFTSPDASLNRN
jgi:hypothetical protein